MLQPRKKITKKELKHDPVVSTYEKALAFYYDNKKYISYSITGFVVLVIVGVIYVNNRRANNEKAAQELGKVFQIYDAGQYRQAIDGVPESGIMGLKSIVDNYSGSSAELARFYLADSYYHLGEYDEALKHFNEFSGDDLLRASALAGVGACYEAKSDYSSAGKYYERAFEQVPESPLASEYLHRAAYSYGKGGNKDRAVALYKKIKKDFPNSAYGRDADRYITEFSM
jgi:tetratricopeptide (TPR) repeat protein